MNTIIEFSSIAIAIAIVIVFAIHSSSSIVRGDRSIPQGLLDLLHHHAHGSRHPGSILRLLVVEHATVCMEVGNDHGRYFPFTLMALCLSVPHTVFFDDLAIELVSPMNTLDGAIASAQVYVKGFHVVALQSIWYQSWLLLAGKFRRIWIWTRIWTWTTRMRFQATMLTNE
jgi:hypothetical protein